MTVVTKNGNYLPYDSSCQKWQFLLTSKLPKMATICRMTVVAKNGNKKGLICYSIEDFSHFFAISGNILLYKVAKNGNYLSYYSSCRKWQYLLTSKLSKMATICRMTIVAKNGNKRINLLLYRGLQSLFSISNILLYKVAKNGNYLPYDSSCQKRQ